MWKLTLKRPHKTPSPGRRCAFVTCVRNVLNASDTVLLSHLALFEAPKLKGAQDLYTLGSQNLFLKTSSDTWPVHKHATFFLL